MPDPDSPALTEPVHLSRLVAMRVPYSAGLLVLGDIRRALAYGRSLGLEAQDHHDGGWLVRQGWIVARGADGNLRAFAAYLGAALPTS